MLARLFVSALVMAMMAVGIQGQTCPTGTAVESCALTDASATQADGSAATLTIGFYYCAPRVAGTNLAYGQGIITQFITGSLQVTPPTSTGGAPTIYAVTNVAGYATTIAPLTAGAFAPLTTFDIPASAGGGQSTVTISGQPAVPIISSAPIYVQGNGITVNSALIPTGLRHLSTVTSSSCNDVAGDPLFRGFKGQEFYVAGEEGQVMNLLSTFNTQLNGRFVQLDEGEAITPAEQEKLRLQSELAHMSEPSTAILPRTTAWSHPGNYFGEVGLALLDDNRVYAKAGPFASGFAKLALNGRQLAVSDDVVVLGQGVNATYIARVSNNELVIRTVNVAYTITNSDNFINVERIHLEKGFRQHNRFDGLLGKTVDAAWSWNAEDEKAAVVQSNDLFAKEQ